MSKKNGFTLIEIMLVTAIMSILLAVGMVRFRNFIRRARESATKANLGAIRSALNIYYADTEGLFPAGAINNPYDGITGLEVPPFVGYSADNYLDAVPYATEDCAAYSNHSINGNDVEATSVLTEPVVRQNGGWKYYAPWGSFFISTNICRIVVDCANVDTKGTTISIW